MSNKNSIRSIPSVEVASSSDTNAPVFYFNQYNQSQEYFNNRERIDFVTYEGSLYVPGAERVVPQTNDITRENFVLLVSRGPQGLPGIKGDPGRDGRTPSVFARFDGKQMIFYTNELNEDGTQKINERTGEPVIKRIAATNDLTGPSWRPKRVDDTIIWEKTRDDSQPESINLSDFVKETAPVIFRVDSDNTKRTDETSGPANYIQWKYEGDEYWNNLISISELMNLALAGVCIWFDETDQEYHLGHRQVLHATYDSSKSGKRIISDVEHGDVLYDAGPIHLPDFEADIAALWEEICALKDRVDAIEEELPKFVKAVIINDKLNKPDEDGIVDLGNLDFYTKEESDERFQPKGDYQPAGNYLTPDDLDFELEKDDNGIKLYVTIKGIRKEVGYTCDCKGHEPTPTVIPVTGVTITNCVSSLKVGNTGTITWNVSPDNATDKSVEFTSSNTSVATVSSTGVVTAKSAGNAVITIKTSDGDYTATCNVTVTDEDEPTPTIPDATVQFNWRPSEANAKFIVNGSSTTNHRFTVGGNETITWKVTAEGYTATSNGEGSWTNDGSTTYKNITIVFEKDSVEPTTYTVTATADSCDPTITVIGLSESATATSWESSLTFNKDTTTHTVFVKATREGYVDRIIEYIASESNSTLTVPCDGWTKDKRKLTINSSNTPTGYSINVGTDVVTLTNNTWEKQYEYGTEIIITAEASGYTSTINPNNFNMTKDTSVDITWTSDEQVTHVTGVSLNENSITLNKSCDAEQTTTFTLKATVKPDDATNKTVTWSKGTSTAVNITPSGSSCKVTPVSAGSATITCTTTDGGKTANCNVTVKENTAITGITLNKTNTTLTVGRTETLSVNSWTPSCTSKPTVTWSVTSDDKSVATVDDTGKVTANTPGTATITATVGNDGPSAACEVTVTSGTVSVTGVSLDKSSITVNTSCDETQTTSETLTATVIPENASNKRVTWSSNDENIVKVSTNGIVTPVASGVATVTVTTEDGNKTADCEVTVTNITNVSSMNINKTTSTLDVGGIDILRILTIEPDCVEVTWNSNNTNVATITPGSTSDKRATVTAEGAGTATITATAGDNRKTVNCIVTVNEPGKGIWFKNNSNLTSIEVAAGSDGSISLYPQGDAQYINLHSGNILTFTTDNAYEYIYLTGNAGGCTVPTKLRNGGTITYQNAPADGCSTENDPILVTVQESGSDTPENTIAD